jgi:hypothetical protein
MVAETIEWYKKHRDVLNGDLIHLRRADGRDWDGWVMVSPSTNERGLIMLFNPLKEKIARRVRIPLYYAGLTDVAEITSVDGKRQTAKLNRAYEIELDVTMEPESYWWGIIGPNSR